MLKSHMDAKENTLVVISKVPANAGHSLHKGTPREAFIKEFLEDHLPENVKIGTGEIIDSNSAPNVQRNQFDIVIYKKNYPKLDFGGGIGGFLIESVVATIEVKSVLDKDGLEQSIKAAQYSKNLSPNVITSFHSGYIPPKVLNYVVAYDGPANMATVYGWIPQIHQSLGVTISNLPTDEQQRINTPSPSIDGVFILNKGFIYFDNTPLGFTNQQTRQKNPDLKWLFADTASGNLLLMFLLIQQAIANVEGKWLNSVPYLQSFQVPNIMLGKA